MGLRPLGFEPVSTARTKLAAACLRTPKAQRERMHLTYQAAAALFGLREVRRPRSCTHRRIFPNQHTHPNRENLHISNKGKGQTGKPQRNTVMNLLRSCCVESHAVSSSALRSFHGSDCSLNPPSSWRPTQSIPSNPS